LRFKSIELCDIGVMDTCHWADALAAAAVAAAALILCHRLHSTVTAIFKLTSHLVESERKTVVMT